jgi:hypothetical protein
MRTTAFIAALAAALPGAGRAHSHERGDGNLTTEPRAVTGFTRVVLRTHLDVEVTEGSAFAVEVTIDKNLQPLVRTRVKGDALVIDAEHSFHSHDGGKVKVALPELRGFAIEGSGDVHIAGADKPRDVALTISGSGDMTWTGKAPALKAKIEGSGDMKLSGSTGKLSAAIEGSGDLSAKELTAGAASLSIAGSGDIAATLDGGPLTASVDGSGDIEWWGKASVESASVSGSGTIRHR